MFDWFDVEQFQMLYLIDLSCQCIFMRDELVGQSDLTEEQYIIRQWKIAFIEYDIEKIWTTRKV